MYSIRAFAFLLLPQEELPLWHFLLSPQELDYQQLLALFLLLEYYFLVNDVIIIRDSNDDDMEVNSVETLLDYYSMLFLNKKDVFGLLLVSLQKK